MCPIAHVPHFSCGLLPMCSIALLPYRPRKEHATYTPSLLFPITHVPNHPTPCAHVSHCSCGLLSIHPITVLPCRSRISHSTLSICPITHIPMSNGHTGDWAAKCQMMSSCQKDVKCQKIKYLDCGGGSQKKLT